MRKYLEIIGKNIEHLLHEKGLTQAEFGKKVNLDQSVISRLIRGKFDNPGLETLVTIVRPFNLTVAWLFVEHTPLKISDTTLKAAELMIKQADHAGENVLSSLWEEIYEVCGDLENTELIPILTGFTAYLKAFARIKPQNKSHPTREKLNELLMSFEEEDLKMLLQGAKALAQEKARKKANKTSG